MEVVAAQGLEMYWETSAKDGYNIDELFEALARGLITGEHPGVVSGD
jgi:GTPase SAR1 family protein